MDKWLFYFNHSLSRHEICYATTWTQTFLIPLSIANAFSALSNEVSFWKDLDRSLDSFLSFFDFFDFLTLFSDSTSEDSYSELSSELRIHLELCKKSVFTSQNSRTSLLQTKTTLSVFSSFLFSTFSPFWTFSSSISLISFLEERVRYRWRSFASPSSTFSLVQPTLHQMIHLAFKIKRLVLPLCPFDCSYFLSFLDFLSFFDFRPLSSDSDRDRPIYYLK